MLGVNEIGYAYDKIIEKNGEVLDLLAKYYKKWGTWIEHETKTLLTGK